MKIIIIKYFILTFTLFLNLALLTGCYDHFPLDQDISRTQNTFFNQDSVEVEFPELTKGKITLMTMVFTHCPDICPMTTHNMHLVDQKLPDKIKDDVKLVVISFDPNRDTPSVLRKYAELREYDFNRWFLLSGDDQNTKEVMLKLDVKAIFTDSTYSDDGELSYNIIHTDRMALIDQNGRLRNNYKGSVANLDEVVEDIEYLSK
ncbi:MAG TPA: SCO family protein [Ignavibacteriaceae bacterium]|nr:SCO family protein [Ignavibacteriaceae bacterium]